MSRRRRREVARAERVLPGLWRLRLPLPWPGIPHVNAYAIASGSGVVLVDSGMHEPGSFAQLELALGQAGVRLEHVRLLACTHAHTDHYGQAGSVVEAAGCELWMHPDHAHMTRAAEDPERQLERRIEIGMHSGVPRAALERYREQRTGEGTGVASVVLPQRDLVNGVELDTDLGRWVAYETPGHAPSHVVLHQPDRRLLLSGDHVLGRVSLYFEFGYTPDPAGEFLSSLDVVQKLDVSLVLGGHGRPVRDLPGLVRANRREVAQGIERVRAAIVEEPRTPFEVVPRLLGTDDLNPMLVNWGLQSVLCYLRHMELRGEAVKAEDGDAERWRAAS